MKFNSSFASKIDNYLSYMAATGKKPSYLFYARLFDDYWINNDFPPILTKERLTAWIKQFEGESISRQHFRITLTRQFGRYLQSEGYLEHYVLPEGLCAKIPKYVPHFFDNNELTIFFDECRRLQPVSGAMHRQIVLPELFSVIYCCGLRPGEARKLLVKDVNFIDGWIDINETKNHRDRRLPIVKTLQEELYKYDNIMKIRLPGRKYFFPVSKETCYKEGLCTTFKKTIKAAGIVTAEGDRIRLYDLRHHFAFANLNRWIASGKNAGSLLPFLQHYMGHSCLSSTEYYLHLVPEFFPTFTILSRPLESNIPEVTFES